MEGIINAVHALEEALDYLAAATEGEAHKVAEKALHSAESIRADLERKQEIKHETASLIVEVMRATTSTL